MKYRIYAQDKPNYLRVANQAHNLTEDTAFHMLEHLRHFHSDVTYVAVPVFTKNDEKKKDVSTNKEPEQTSKDHTYSEPEQTIRNGLPSRDMLDGFRSASFTDGERIIPLKTREDYRNTQDLFAHQREVFVYCDIWENSNEYARKFDNQHVILSQNLLDGKAKEALREIFDTLSVQDEYAQLRVPYSLYEDVHWIYSRIIKGTNQALGLGKLLEIMDDHLDNTYLFQKGYLVGKWEKFRTLWGNEKGLEWYLEYLLAHTDSNEEMEKNT